MQTIEKIIPKYLKLNKRLSEKVNIDSNEQLIKRIVNKVV